MTDRELLELAAEAAGYIIDFEEPVNGFYVNGYDENGDPAAWWNPLIDDGDALRLAVKLGLDVRNALYTDAVYVDCFEIISVEIEYDGDPYAATRRAIVRAAAEIGRNM